MIVMILTILLVVSTQEASAGLGIFHFHQSHTGQLCFFIPDSQGDEVMFLVGDLDGILKALVDEVGDDEGCAIFLTDVRANISMPH